MFLREGVGDTGQTEEDKEEPEMEVFTEESSHSIALSEPPQVLPNSPWGCGVVLSEEGLKGPLWEREIQVSSAL